MSPEQTQELLSRLNLLEAENADLKEQNKRNGLKMKVSQKGAISVYGMGRFPVTLYADQWKRIDQELIQSGHMDNFIEDNRPDLTFKKQLVGASGSAPRGTSYERPRARIQMHQCSCLTMKIGDLAIMIILFYFLCDLVME